MVDFSTHQVLGGSSFPALVNAVRDLQNRMAAALPPSEVVRDIAHQVSALADQLKRWEQPEGMAPAGRRGDLPGRGHPLIPPWSMTAMDKTSVRGRVTFARAHVGSGNAVHGGMQPLLFDDVLSICSRQTGRVTRTVHMEVDYRALTPIDVPLDVVAMVESIDGRKIWITGRIELNQEILCECRALFIELKRA